MGESNKLVLFHKETYIDMQPISKLYRIAGNFCVVFISAILRFLSAIEELKTTEYISL